LLRRASACPPVGLPSVPVDGVDRTRDHRAAARARGPAPAGSAAGVSISRPTVLGSGEPDVAEGQLVVVSRHGGHASALAPASGGESLDVHAPRRSSADQSGRSGIDRVVGTRKSTMGYFRIAAELKGLRDCVSDDCEYDHACIDDHFWS